LSKPVASGDGRVGVWARIQGSKVARAGEIFSDAGLRNSELLFARVEVGDGLDNQLLVGVGEFGVDRKRERFLTGFFGDGKLPGTVAERRESLLKVEAERVIDFGGNTSEAERFLQFVAATGAHSEVIER